MAVATGLVVTKRFTYRDDPTEEWSNKYWFTGTPPANDGAWRTLFDQLVGIEKTCWPSTVKAVSGYAYNDNTPGANAVWSVDLTALGQEVAGNLSTATGTAMSGDQAAMVWWKTSRKNSRGKWIYLRKYFHAGHTSATDHDELDAATRTAMIGFSDVMTLGTWTGGRVIRSQLQDEILQAHGVGTYVTTRSLKRRGKRP